MSLVFATKSKITAIANAIRTRSGSSSSMTLDQMASAIPSLPNSYSAGDEGKVVSSGALISQTAHADVTPTTSDQTIDTTTNNSIKVKGDADLVATNIKKDVQIFGVTGSYEGGGGNIGGLSNMVDVNSQTYQFAYMLMKMKKGETAGGTVTFTTAFPNTETKILETGLTTLHGLLMVGTGMDITASGTGQTHRWFFLTINTDDSFNMLGQLTQNANGSVVTSATQNTAYNNAPINGSLRFSGGDVYYTGRYNGNANYQILAVNQQYDWLAW